MNGGGKYRKVNFVLDTRHYTKLSVCLCHHCQCRYWWHR